MYKYLHGCAKLLKEIFRKIFVLIEKIDYPLYDKQILLEECDNRKKGVLQITSNQQPCINIHLQVHPIYPVPTPTGDTNTPDRSL